MTFRSRIILAFFCNLLLACAAAAQPTSAGAPITRAERAALFPSAAQLERGRELAERNCAGCHGLDGISDDPELPHLAGQRPVYLYRTLVGYQTDPAGRGTMAHSVEFLNEEALLRVSAYYASLEPPTPAHADDPEAVARLLADDDPLRAGRTASGACAMCHGDTGNAKRPGMPNLTAQSPEYFIASMNAYRGIGVARDNRMMGRLMDALEDADIENMAIFYALQEPARTPNEGTGDIDAGRTLAAGCENCHGADGNVAKPDMPTLAGQDPRYLVKAMKAYRAGERAHGPMVSAMEEIDDAGIDDLATFYAAQEPLRRDVRAPLSTEEWIERCARCHGPGGNSTDPRYPALAAQQEAYLARAMAQYASGERGDSMMHAMASPLSVEDVARLAAYYSMQRPRSVIYVDLPEAE